MDIRHNEMGTGEHLLKNSSGPQRRTSESRAIHDTKYLNQEKESPLVWSTNKPKAKGMRIVILKGEKRN